MRLLGRITNKVLTLFFNLIEPKTKPIEPATPQLVAKRFRQLFTDHGLEETQIPRLFPKISLDDLTSDEKLIKKLSPDLINEAAEYFNVNSAWIEGVDSTVYDFITCYNRPKVFFDLLKTIKYEALGFPFRIITPVEKFDYQNQGYQPFSLLFVEKIAELGDEDIHRYYLDTGWAWNESNCRIQLKAMALLYWKQVRHPITIYTIPQDIYLQIEGRQIVPDLYLTGALLSTPSLEDYILEKNQSVVAKECDELPIVHAYIEEHHLNDFVLGLSDTSDHREIDLNIEGAIQNNQNETLQQKASNARHEPTNQLKRDCVLFWLKNQKYSNNEAARRFYNALMPERKRLLSESNAEKTLSLAISEFKRRETLDKLPKWLIGFNPENS